MWEDKHTYCTLWNLASSRIVSLDLCFVSFLVWNIKTNGDAFEPSILSIRKIHFFFPSRLCLQFSPAKTILQKWTQICTNTTRQEWTMAAQLVTHIANSG